MPSLLPLGLLGKTHHTLGIMDWLVLLQFTSIGFVSPLATLIAQRVAKQNFYSPSNDLALDLATWVLTLTPGKLLI